MTRSKFNNQRIEQDGYIFDSLAEAARWTELKLLRAAGEIEHIEVHPRFLLVDAFRYNGKRYRPVYYEGDFRYTNVRTGKVFVEDVKGFETDLFKIKEKLLLTRYPYINFIKTAVK